MKRAISVLLIVLGLIVISLPIIQNKIIANKTDNINKSVTDLSYDEIRKNSETDDAEFDYEAIEDVSPKNVIFGTMDFDEKNIIGQLSIPDLNVDLPLLKGVTNANLAVGVTTMRKDQEMGKGNYPVSGHHMKNKSLLFGSLMDIELGTKVFVTDKNTVYEYKIYDIVVVEDTAMYMIEESQSENIGKPILSLMTCYHTSRTGKRFFALGELIDEYPYEEMKENQNNADN